MNQIQNIIPELKNLKKYSNLLNKIKINELGFDSFTRIIRNKCILQDFRNFFSKLIISNETSKIKIITRKFMSSYVIMCFPEHVFTNMTKDVDDLKLKDLAIKLSMSFCEILGNQNINSKKLDEFRKNLNSYLSFFDKWKKKDLIKTLIPFANSYFQLNQTLDDMKKGEQTEATNIWIKELETQKQKILKQVKRIDGKDAVNFVENYKPPNIVIDDRLYKQIEITFKKAYWDKFKEDIEAGDFSLVSSLVKDVKSMIFNLIPNRKDLKEEFDQKIDIELLEQMILHKAIKLEDVYNIAMKLIEYIKMLQAPIDDCETEIWCNNIKELFYKDTILYSDILPTFFRGIFEKLEKIREKLIEFYKILNENKLK